MKKRRLLSIILCFSIVFSFVFIKDTPKAGAIYPTSATIANLFPEFFGATGAMGTLVTTVTEWVKNNWEAMAVTAAKMAALWAVQKITAAIIGDADSGGGGAVTDWNIYLNIAPKQRAMAEMNSFFNTVSRGRLSSLNYEGVGPVNYDAYLVSQARMAIAGSSFTTNLPEVVTNPTQPFAGGNMKGIMTYMQCANNVACYTLTSTARYNSEFAKAQEIAKNEQDKGFLPTKKNGKITKPAALLSGAFNQMDQLGTQVIMNADAKAGVTAGLSQIGQGALISFAAKNLNYATSDAAGRDAVRNGNSEIPFSLGYSANGGLGISAGGVTVNTGLAGINGCIQIGNTAASGTGTINGAGQTYVDINGQKKPCPPNSNNAGFTPPTITNFSLPQFKCAAGNVGDGLCTTWFGPGFTCGGDGKCKK